MTFKNTVIVLVLSISSLYSMNIERVRKIEIKNSIITLLHNNDTTQLSEQPKNEIKNSEKNSDVSYTEYSSEDSDFSDTESLFDENECDDTEPSLPTMCMLW